MDSNVRNTLNKIHEKRQALDEALSFSDVWRHAEERGGFMIIASDRPELETEEQKQAEWDRLINRVRSEGLGYYIMDGKWKYSEDEPVQSELSLFVPYRDTMTSQEFYDLAIDLVSDFDQEAGVVGTPEMDPLAVLVNGVGNVIEEFEDVRYDKIADVYSQIRSGSYAGRTFVIEGIWGPTTLSEALSYYKRGGLLHGSFDD